jgi:hypothetical protein
VSSETPTTGWAAFFNFCTRCVELLIDRNRGAILLIIALVAVFWVPLAFRLDSTDSRDVFIHFLNLSFRPATVLLVLGNFAQYFWCRRSGRIYKNEIARLVRYKHWYFHYKSDPEKAKELENLVDVKHVSTDFDIRGD